MSNFKLHLRTTLIFVRQLVNNVHVTVFLVSLKAGGVALNLTEASRVYLMDSWWNPAVEFRTFLPLLILLSYTISYSDYRGHGPHSSFGAAPTCRGD